jgi:hypothetical protein
MFVKKVEPKTIEKQRDKTLPKWKQPKMLNKTKTLNTKQETRPHSSPPPPPPIPCPTKLHTLKKIKNPMCRVMLQNDGEAKRCKGEADEEEEEEMQQKKGVKKSTTLE